MLCALALLAFSLPAIHRYDDTNEPGA